MKSRLRTCGVSVRRRVHQRERQLERHLTAHGADYKFDFHIVRDVNGKHIPVLRRHAHHSAGQRAFRFVHRRPQRILQRYPIFCPRFDRVQQVFLFQRTSVAGYRHVRALFRCHGVFEFTIAEHTYIDMLYDKNLNTLNPHFKSILVDSRTNRIRALKTRDYLKLKKKYIYILFRRYENPSVGYKSKCLKSILNGFV